MTRITVGILLFPDVEVLDFAGPYEVFSRTRLIPGVESRLTDDSSPFEMLTVGTVTPLVATGGLRVLPDCVLEEAPPIDILVIPGGFGTRSLLEEMEVLSWIAERVEAAQLVTSVCTGSLLLSKVGALKGKRATTHWAALDLLEGIDPEVDVQRDRRVVDDGVITSAGVSAGIEMALAVVAKLCGQDVAEETARYIEYPYFGKLRN